MISQEEIWRLARQFTTDRIAAGHKPVESYVRGAPHPKQGLFLALEHDEVLGKQKMQEALFGGATGGGKSWTLLAAALMYVDVPHYSALLLRRNFPDLKQEGGLMSLAQEWLSNSAAVWHEQDKTWTFPSGATLRFGYLETENDKFRYQGGEYQFIGFDELTQFTETQYKYLFSRLRKRSDINVPLRMFSATNPGGIGGKWVFDRFIPEDFTAEQAREMRVWYKEQPSGAMTAFVPSLLDDNPSLDREAYLESMMELDEITRQQYLNGDWQIKIRGDILYTYSEAHTVISWSQFAAVYGRKEIPPHWKIGVYQDFGTSKGHPCITSWFATAGENAPPVNGVPMAGRVFLYRGLMSTQTSAFEMGKLINEAMPRYERSQATMWQMSHEAASERIEYNKQGLPFSAWPTGFNRGIEQLKNAFMLIHQDKPHPFKPSLMGSPRLFLVVDDEELVYAKTDRGLARWREEIVSYEWATMQSGEPLAKLRPRKMFDDAVDTMRAAAADYFPRLTGKTVAEKVAEHVEAVQPLSYLESVTDPQLRAHLITQRGILESRAREEFARPEVAVPTWQELG